MVEVGPDTLGSTAQGRTRQDGAAAGGTQRTVEKGKAEAGALWNDAKTGMRSILHEKQSSTASEIGEFAGALRNASRSINQDGPARRIASHAADSLERLSDTLRNRDFDSLMREVQGFAQSQPAVFLGMAVAAGFLATRFLKSSASHADSGVDYERGTLRRAGQQPETTAPASGGDWPFPQDLRRT